MKVAVSQPPFRLSGSSCAGLTCFHQLVRSRNSLWVVPPRSRLRLRSGARPTSGRDCRGLRGSIFGSMRQDRPGNPRMPGRECDGGDIHLPTLLEPPRPLAFGVSLLVDDAQVGSGAVHQQCAQVAMALASNLPQAPLAATRALSGRNAEPGGKAAPHRWAPRSRTRPTGHGSDSPVPCGWSS